MLIQIAPPEFHRDVSQFDIAIIVYHTAIYLSTVFFVFLNKVSKIYGLIEKYMVLYYLLRS